MWILESRGDFLEGKRMWLKPGQKYLFGRVKKDGVLYAIDSKTVSRKHFIIDVSDVQENEVTQIHTRTKITIIDQNSHMGTLVNGQLLQGKDFASKELKASENSIRPGHADELVIRWQPCILSFYLLKKELKAGALKSKQDRIKSLGIKAISEFVPDYTTHVVAGKRNTPKGLQALIAGKHLVGEGYIDAIEYVSTPRSLDEGEDLSPLELDFDSNWPHPKGYLPSPGKEPTTKSAEHYQPGLDRTHIFEDFVFVFGDEHQCSNLLPVITLGHGKAITFKVTDGVTTVDEAVQYMRNASGSKSFGASSNENGHGGVIMVRWNSSPEYADWVTQLINEVALKLNQRAIDQSEFLDAILANDAYLLKQSVPYDNSGAEVDAPPPTPQKSSTSVRQPPHTLQRQSKTANRGDPSNPVAEGQRMQQTSTHSPPSRLTAGPDATAQSQPPGMKGNSMQGLRKEILQKRGLTQVKFDDGFDASGPRTYDETEEDDPAEESPEVYDPDPGDHDEPETNSVRKRKLPASPIHEDSRSNDIDDLLPAANAMKRQKLAADAEARRTGKSLPSSSAATSLGRSRKMKEPEIDIREIAKAQRMKEEAARKEQEEQEERFPPHDADDRAPANLVQIEVMEMPIRNNKSFVRTNPEDDPRWDPRWNGRKNFKKFTPQQTGASTRHAKHATKVIVPVIEVKSRSDGLGDQYWEKGREEKERGKRRKDKAKSQRSQTQTQTQTQSPSARRTTGSTNQIEAGSDDESDASVRQTSPAAVRLQQEAASIVEHEIDPDSPRTTRSQGVGSQAPAHGKKRQASRPAASATKKRQKTLPVTTVHGSDSEGDDSDDMKFKFGSRRRAKAKA